MPRTSRIRPTSQRASQSDQLATLNRPAVPLNMAAIKQWLLDYPQLWKIWMLWQLKLWNNIWLLVNSKLPTTGAKAILVHRLYNAIHGESSQTTQTENPTATLRENRGARNFNTILYRVLEISTKTYNLLSRKSKFLRNLYDFIRNFLRKSIS